jgi:hypothetical protein
VRTECAFHLDDRGEVHLRSGSTPLQAVEVPEDELAAVTERGFVEWRLRDGHVSVRLRPSLVSSAAYARLMSWLLGHRPERVLLSYFVEGRWEYEFLRQPGEAARRVRWLIELHGGGGYCNARRRRIPISANCNPPDWRRAVDFWSTSEKPMPPWSARP